MDVMVGISAVSQALNVAKQLKEFEKQFNSAEFKLKIAELYSSLADAKMSLADAKETIDAKTAEIAKLKLNFQRRSDDVRVRDFLYEKAESGHPTGWPFCPRCDEIDGVRIKLAQNDGMRGNVVCPECKAKFIHVTHYNGTQAPAV
jgi:hypothetical protein